MQKYLTVLSSFLIMLCLGGVYAWSIFVPHLMDNYGLSSVQTQLIFGLIIAVFPTTMLFAGKLEKRYNAKVLTIISAVFFSVGYILAALSNGNYVLILLGIGILVGIGTGFGYLAALTTPVKWFPEKKGLITGIAAAGFGLAAVVLSFFAETLLMQGRSVLQIFLKIGIVYGVIILVFAFFMKAPASVVSGHRVDVRYFSKSPEFRKLVAGIFLGTFAGLLVIGSLSPMGAQYGIDNHVLVLGVSAFAVANFCGRLFWGFISDYINSKTAIFIALTLQAFAIFFIGYLSLTEFSFLVLSVLIGFGFGSNFVLFAKETSQKYGIGNMGIVYPYVFMGYAVAGIIGPMTGGLLFDYFQNYQLASYIAALMSFAGAMVSLVSINSKA